MLDPALRREGLRGAMPSDRRACTLLTISLRNFSPPACALCVWAGVGPIHRRLRRRAREMVYVIQIRRLGARQRATNPNPTNSSQTPQKLIMSPQILNLSSIALAAAAELCVYAREEGTDDLGLE